MKQEKPTTKTKMTEQEKQDWDKLYQYVKTEILNYTDDMALPKHIVLRLRGLSNGQYIANNKCKKNAKYPYSTILLTFKFCKSNIIKALEQKQFKNEQNKFNYIMAIIENNINDVAMRLKNKEKAEIESERQIQKVQVDISFMTNHTKEQNNIALNKNENENSNFDNLVGDMW